MFRRLVLIIILMPACAIAAPWFDGSPDYLDDASRTLSQEVLEGSRVSGRIGDDSGQADPIGREFVKELTGQTGTQVEELGREHVLI